MSNLCLNCISNTKTSCSLHLPTGEAPSWTHFLLPLCPAGWHLMLSSNGLLPSWALFSGEREVGKTQEFCLILANIIMTKPLNCEPCRALSPHSSHSLGMKHTRKEELEQQLRCLPSYFYPHRWFALLPNIAEHWAINLTSFPRIICPQVTLPCFQIPPLTLLFPRPSVICFTAQYSSLTASPICLV